jgi:hypothetical protein
MLINAPEGYVIDSVVVEMYNWFNVSLYAGTDAKGTALVVDDTTAVTAVNTKYGKANSITVDNSSLYIVNASTYTNSAYFITVNLKAASK